MATWGTRSVANRMLSFAYKRFDGRVPEPGELDAEDRALLAKVEVGFEEETRLHLLALCASIPIRAGEARARGAAYDHSGAIGTWTKSELPPGQALREPALLFRK